MLIAFVWMALQSLEATQNNMVVRNLGVMVYIIVCKDICKGSFLAQCSQDSLEQTGYPNNKKSYSALCLTASAKGGRQ